MMFKELLKIWHSEEHKKMNAKNTMNRLVGKKKNIMPTTGPKSFARVREEWKKERKTTRNPPLAGMFITTRKKKRTKRKPDDPIDKFIDKKKCQFLLYGRDVSSTLLKQKAMLEEAKKKNDEKMESLQKDYEDKRQQDKRELARGLQSLHSQIQQQNPYMSFYLSIFGSLLLDDQSKKDVPSRRDSSKMLQLQSPTDSDCLNDQGFNMEEEQDYDEDFDDEDLI
ncbi:UvrABC system protein C [Bienertia sinuspersici]